MKKLMRSASLFLPDDVVPHGIREAIKNRLTLVDRHENEFKLYTETQAGLHVPKYFWCAELQGSYLLVDEVPSPPRDVVKMICPYEPFDYQVHILDKLAASGPHKDMGIHADCGIGKTFIACYEMCRAGGQSLVAVPNRTKMGEWIEEIQKFCGITKDQIGIIAGGAKNDWQDKPVVIGVVNSLALRDFPLEDNRFSRVFWDEAHLVPSPILGRCLGRFRGKQIPMTATPGQGIGRTILDLTCGGKWIRGEMPKLPIRIGFVKVKVPRYHGEWMYIKSKIVSRRKYITVVKQIWRALKKDGRRVMVMSNSIDPLCQIYKTEGGGFVIGASSLKDTVFPMFPEVKELVDGYPGRYSLRVQQYKEHVKTLNPILGTATGKRMPAGVGFNVPDLGGGVLILPIGNMDHFQQIVGRLNRPHPRKTNAALWVIVPTHPVALRMMQQMIRKCDTMQGVTVITHERVFDAT